MPKRNSKNKGPWIVGGLLLMAGYVWQKKIVISNVDADIPVYANEDFLSSDAPVKKLDIKKGDKLGRLLRKFEAPDYGVFYIVQTPDGLFGFISQQTIDDGDIRLGFI